MTTNNAKKPDKKRGRPFTTKEMVTVSALIAMAMVMSYLDSQIPIFDAFIPGYRIGLANVATVFALYIFGWPCAILVSILRVILTFFMFARADTYIISLCGAVFALVAMILLKQLGKFSPVIVSVAGGLAHNVGQIIAAIFILRTPQIGYTLIFTLVVGTVTGILIGIISGILIKRLKKFL